ncbi:hypothetical protein GCM10023347_38600 [Streptomyces chumphonensis]
MGEPEPLDDLLDDLRENVARRNRAEAAERLAVRGERGEFAVAARASADAKRARRAALD